jgi:predicted RNase H-like HicB family nuclease/DNA-binding CsgD family transcriptional regulator
MKWAIIIEKGKRNYGGYVPDLPGIGVVGDSPEEIKNLLAEAIELYVQEQDGATPEPVSTADYVEVPQPLLSGLERKVLLTVLGRTPVARETASQLHISPEEVLAIVQALRRKLAADRHTEKAAEELVDS